MWEEKKEPAGWIGVVSDTHVPKRAPFIPSSLYAILEGASYILHAGDLVEEKVLMDLFAIAPVKAVAGNMDPIGLQRKLGQYKIIEFQGKKIGLIHGRGKGDSTIEHVYREFSTAGVEAVVFGHLHKPVMTHKNGVLLFNPGSPTDPRGGSVPSCGKIWINRERVVIEVVYL